MFGGQCETVLETAANYGFEDALEGEDMRGSVYFVGAQLESYNHAYGQGLVAKQGIMADVRTLDGLRADAGDWVCSSCGATFDDKADFMRHRNSCDAATEWIGLEFCTQPYLF